MDIVSVRRTMSTNSHRPAKIAGMQIRCASSRAGQNVIKITSTEMQKCTSESVKDAFLHRTHTCGELGAEHVGLKVSLCGWISHNHFCKFIHLKDGYGVVQAVVPSHKEDVISVVKTTDIDTTVEISGVVKYRPSGHESPAMETGLIEVVIDTFALAENRKPVNKDDSNASVPNSNVNLLTNRTHTCGQLREEHINQDVTLCGWLAYERMNKFLLIRDAYGITQCVVSDDSTEIIQQIKEIPHESVLQIEGVVTSRPPNSIKNDIPTGQIEVCVKKLTILNKAIPNLPFNIREYNKAHEALRLKHRYLDLRFDEMQYNLRLRSKLTMKIREFLINHCDFVDVETPTLFRKTPGGAQEFIVPTQHPGKCYSLVQSPQQMKQMLMIGGIDKYFQIARCYRDEGSRSDRQPEFTQLDIEMSFTTREGVMELIERLLKYACGDFPIDFPFPKMTYSEALTKFGTDKPDLRYEFLIEDCCEDFQTHPDKENYDQFAAHCIVIREADSKVLKALQKFLNDFKNKTSDAKCIYSTIPSDVDAWVTKISSLLTETVATSLRNRFGLQENDLLILGYGHSTKVLQYLGNARSEYIKKLEEKPETKYATNKFLWIIDFPLFESGNEGLTSTHHPFTQPHPEDMDKLESKPLQVRSLAYDLVLNGVEVGGGSIRIHDAKFQRKILELLKIDPKEMNYFLDALEMGAPPHGGIALGLDRFLSTLLNLKSIREVIAFPKTIDGKDVLSEAPSDITQEDLHLYNLELKETSNVPLEQNN